MTTMASKIPSLTVVYSTVYSDVDQRKHQSSASLAFVWGIHRGRWIPRTKGQLRGKCFHLMTSSWGTIDTPYLTQGCHCVSSTLTRKCRHFGEILETHWTRSCHLAPIPVQQPRIPIYNISVQWKYDSHIIGKKGVTLLTYWNYILVCIIGLGCHNLSSSWQLACLALPLSSESRVNDDCFVVVVFVLL